MYTMDKRCNCLFLSSASDESSKCLSHVTTLICVRWIDAHDARLDGSTMVPSVAHDRGTVDRRRSALSPLPLTPDPSLRLALAAPALCRETHPRHDKSQPQRSDTDTHMRVAAPSPSRTHTPTLLLSFNSTQVPVTILYSRRCVCCTFMRHHPIPHFVSASARPRRNGPTSTSHHGGPMTQSLAPPPHGGVFLLRATLISSCAHPALS